MRNNDDRIKIIYTDSDWLLDQGRPAWGAEIPHSLNPVVLEAIAALPERHRSVVTIRLYGQWTFQDIADDLGMPSRGYAYMYWSRGLKKIRDFIVNHPDTSALLKEARP